MAGDRTTVLMTADTVGGVWTYAVELSKALVAEGMEVHLATMGGPVREAQRAQLGDARGITLHEGGFRLEWMNEPWADVDRAGEWLLELEARVRPQLVHLNQFAFGALPFAAPKLVVAHSCVLSWWEAVRGVPAPAEWDEYHRRVSRGLAGADLVGAPTQAMLDTLAPHYGFKGRGCVLPNGRDPALFQPAAKQPYVLAAGRFWDEAKNLTALECVAPRLPWPVRVAGSCIAPHGGMLQPRGVQALGELDAPSLAGEMAHASIYALPARYEPFGLSILEAAQSGCALVLGDIASLRETWGDAALYVHPDDHLALRELLVRLMQDDAARETLASKARSRALAFDPGCMKRAYLDAYAALLPRPASLSLEESACVS